VIACVNNRLGSGFVAVILGYLWTAELRLYKLLPSEKNGNGWLLVSVSLLLWWKKWSWVQVGAVVVGFERNIVYYKLQWVYVLLSGIFKSYLVVTCFDARHASPPVSWWILGQGLEGENYKHVQESSSGSCWWMDRAWFSHSIPVSEKVDCDRTKSTLQVLDLSSRFGCDNLDWL